MSEGLANLISFSRKPKVRYLMWWLAGLMKPFPSRDIRQSEPDQKPPIPKPNKTLFIHFLEIKV